MDTYQPIYDAVRSRIAAVDIGGAVADAIRGADIGHHAMMAAENIRIIASDYSRPSVLYRPAISIDGNKWCALYGANLQDGVAGFGDSPAEAMAAFDEAWRRTLKDERQAAAIATEERREKIRANGQFGVGA